MNYHSRLEKYRDFLRQEKNVQGVLLTDRTNIRYLCGFSGSCGYLLVTKKDAWFFTDFRYQEQSAREIGDLAKVEIFYNNAVETIFKKVKAARIKCLGVEKNISLQSYLTYVEEFAGKIEPITDHVRTLRQIKDEDELKSLKKAFAIADKAFADLLDEIKPGMTEIEVAARLEYSMKCFGSEAPSFSTIIAAGPNSSCPHAQPTMRKLKAGEMVKIDFGATWQGYHSDMTRTVFLGPATDKFKKVYEIVLRAQQKAIKALKPGMKCKDIDKIARDEIIEAGYGDYFGHGLGHSYGLEIHEAPSLSAKCDAEIEPGMTFTVEPGIYLPGWGGIRIEDSFLVEKDGLIKLTRTPNSLLQIKV
ncbi:MAG: M24 family metallopeptidase [Candidatus Rifleibacteriota bacterium]